MPVAATDAFLETLRAALPEGRFRAARDGELDDPRGRHKGLSAIVALPRSVDEVSTILRHCHAENVGVVPLAGGTGLVLGQVAIDDPAPVILSLERMTAVRAVYPSENAMVVEAGAILHDVQAAAEAVDRLFPLSLASEGTCRIGGNLATNAGGLNVLRYGNTRDLCLGLEVVLADGTIWNGLKRLRKDNTGYDLKNLMIGSEGSLGIITAATLRLFPRPSQEAAAIFVVDNPQGAIDLLALAQATVGEGISAFEMMSGVGLDFLTETMPNVRQPFDKKPDWSVLIDLGLSGANDPQEALLALFQVASEAGLVSDGVISQSETQRQEFWAVRENIPVGNRNIGSISSHDISIPLSRIPEFIPEGIAKLQALGDVRINCFGHLGDGNLHYNVFPAKGRDRKDFDDIRADVKKCVHDLTHAYDGSVSAEHGVGRLKVEDLERYQDPVKLAAMRAIKDALDPKGIMNPGAVLRQKT